MHLTSVMPPRESVGNARSSWAPAAVEFAEITAVLPFVVAAITVLPTLNAGSPSSFVSVSL